MHIHICASANIPLLWVKFIFRISVLDSPNNDISKKVQKCEDMYSRERKYDVNKGYIWRRETGSIWRREPTYILLMHNNCPLHNGQCWDRAPNQ